MSFEQISDMSQEVCCCKASALCRSSVLRASGIIDSLSGA